MFHEHDRLGINCWVPLTAAGKDRPGVAVMPLGVRQTRAYLKYSGNGYESREGEISNMNHFRHENLAQEELQKAGLSFVSPQLVPGDALVFTNFTIHATYINRGMTDPRTSIECRTLVDAPELLDQIDPPGGRTPVAAVSRQTKMPGGGQPRGATRRPRRLGTRLRQGVSKALRT
jgi:ectoine hydroxylase-related dioxygenase (phytanoyl-CoA dioxygenase family)